MPASIFVLSDYSCHDATLLIHDLKYSPYADADFKRLTAAIDAKVLLVNYRAHEANISNNVNHVYDTYNIGNDLNMENCKS